MQDLDFPGFANSRPAIWSSFSWSCNFQLLFLVVVRHFQVLQIERPRDGLATTISLAIGSTATDENSAQSLELRLSRGYS